MSIVLLFLIVPLLVFPTLFVFFAAPFVPLVLLLVVLYVPACNGELVINRVLTAAASVKGNIDFILFLAFDCLQRKFLNNSFIILGMQKFIITRLFRQAKF